MARISIIGAGNVGGMAALRILGEKIADVVLVDTAENLALAKACDLQDARGALGFDYSISAGSDFSLISGSDIVIITAGLARKPGMKREDLLNKNAEIIESVAKEINKYADKAICIVVSNPVDVMTRYFLSVFNADRFRAFGMGMNLDASRFANLIAKKLKISPNKIKAVVLGAHGENMLPLPRLTLVEGKPLTSLLSKDEIEELVKQTVSRGAYIVNLYACGSAYFAPSAALLAMARAILNNSQETIGASVYLNGEYGIRDVCIGVPVILGSGGIKEIVNLQLTKDELYTLQTSADSLKSNFNLIACN
ncbi:MAG: malate dehydrogenase [Candidatus Omnitrophica bacterium CG11_big_fil_rev_8_21_14_0_20_42_13]|uniref:Malate dehydrogenase n=1 Tax=Candidatus Ghiorseimicrobium undicola TaxID=1974746 RepID=A0A2H0LYT1_9BACT|nr:MAG: malate dehydrogenase [Candidatus Omnitrophica bacterium CG11_big_fil_rev_8_21_14_0_20_42_13]